MSEYRTPEEDTIGGQHDIEDEAETGTSPEPGDKRAPDENEVREP
jgi:hypothetical protein